MEMFDLKGHKAEIDGRVFSALMFKFSTIAQTLKTDDPLWLFLRKVDMGGYFTIKEAKKVKGRLSSITKKWEKNRLKFQINEVISLFSVAVNHRRRVYIKNSI